MVSPNTLNHLLNFQSMIQHLYTPISMMKTFSTFAVSTLAIALNPFKMVLSAMYFLGCLTRFFPPTYLD